MQTLGLELVDWHNREYHNISIKYALIRAYCCKSIVCILGYAHSVFLIDKTSGKRFGLSLRTHV